MTIDMKGYSIYVPAIKALYPNVRRIEHDENAGVYDGEGNQIVVDDDAIVAKQQELNLETAWAELRTERNSRLAKTDFYGMPDVTMSAEMTVYRQALRDLPANTSDPFNPVWPVLSS
tara:strand:+ start:837 stop:1187 length:351 start_codon:yes stop_codon:yes gene_type:complete